ncbi:MAG: hypothetical protein V4479_12420, partial [Actinomycetota bacterium]
TVASDTTGTRAVGVGVGDLAGQPSNGEVDIHTISDSGAAGSCGFSGDPFGCVATSSNTGLHVAVVRQDFTNPAAHPFGTNIYYTVPSTPTVTSGSFSGDGGQVTIHGGGTIGDSIAVYEEGAPVCNATVTDADGVGIWSCTSSDPISGYHTYYAYQIDTLTGSDYTTTMVPADADYQTGSYSASSLGTTSGSFAVGDENELPTTTYSFSPGAVTVTPATTGGATSVGVRVSEDGGDFDYNQISDCTDNAACPVGALDGGTSYRVDTTQSWPDENSTTLTEYFWVPTTPDSPSATDNGDLTADISGTGSAGDLPIVYQVGDPDTRICATLTALTTDFSTWNCTSPTEEEAGGYGFGVAVSNDVAGAAAIPEGGNYVPGG